jgi:hypothetical protein
MYYSCGRSHGKRSYDSRGIGILRLSSRPSRNHDNTTAMSRKLHLRPEWRPGHRLSSPETLVWSNSSSIRGYYITSSPAFLTLIGRCRYTGAGTNLSPQALNSNGTSMITPWSDLWCASLHRRKKFKGWSTIGFPAPR